MALIDMLPATPLQSDFKVFTGVMEIAQDGSPAHDPIVRMTGSSTEQDLHGDTMRLSSLEDMTQVDDHLLIWLNHSYNLPGDLFGALVEAPRLQRAVRGLTDLHLAVEVEMSNPDAARTYAYIERRSRRLGCSVGCQVLEFMIPGVDPDDDEEMFWSMIMGAPIEIVHVKAVEWSIVGIPANQRSWVENAINGLFTRSLDIRLAPAMKGLFPADYRKIVSGIEDPDLRQKYLNVPARGSKGSVKWDFNAHVFEFRKNMNQKEPDSIIKREHVGDFLLTKSLEKPSAYVQALIKKGLPTDGLVISQDDLAFTATSNPTDAVTSVGDVTVSVNVDTAPLQEALEVITEAVEDEIETFKKSDPDGGVDDATEGSDKQAQEDRSSKYHIGIKEGGNVTKPGKWSSVPDSEWGDPVNYAYPMPDESHARNALSRWGDASNRSKYDENERSIVTGRIHRRCEHFGIDVSDEDKGKDFDPELVKAGDPGVDPPAAGEVMCDENGNHIACYGMHNHIHNSFGAYNTDGMHAHDHEHNGDSDHSPDGRTHVHEPGGEGAGDGNIDPPKAAGDEAHIHTHATAHEFTDTEVEALQARYKALGELLGVTPPPSQPTDAEVLESVLAKAFNIIKAGREFSNDNMATLQHLHDTLDTMCGGELCKGKLTEPGGEATTTQQAEDQARQSRDRDDTIPSQGTTLSAVAPIVKALDAMTLSLGNLDIKTLHAEVEAMRGFLAKAHQELETLTNNKEALSRQIEDLTRMPLGRPTQFNRTIDRDPSATSFKLLSLPDHPNDVAGTEVVYRAGIGKMRHWHAGTTNRPPLTPEQIIGMTNEDISRYTKEEDAFVPMIGE